jgi:DNA-binding Lrp family transcriptional regulator
LSQFLASVNIFVEPSEKGNVLAALTRLQNIEEVYEVAGEYDIVSVVSASCLEEFRDVLHKEIMKIKGVKSTITTVVMESHKGPKCKAKKSEAAIVK